MSENIQELDAGDFEPLPQVAGDNSIETESQSHKGSAERSKGKEEAVGEAQSIKTSPKRDWDRRKVIDWDSIKEAMIAGMGAEDCAARFGSTAGSIRVRSHTEQWPTPERIKREAEKRIREAQADLQRAREMRQRKPGTKAGWKQERDGIDDGTGIGEGGWNVDESSGEWGGLSPSSVTSRQNSTLVMLAEDRAAMAEQGITEAMSIGLNSLRSAPRRLEIRTISDAHAAMKLLKNGAGLDSPQVAVNLGLFTSNQPDAASLGVVIDDCAETGD